MMDSPSSTSSSSPSSELAQSARLALRFVLPLLAVLVALNLVVAKWDLEPHHRRTYQDARHFGPEGVDTLVMGASNGKYGVDPKALEASLGTVLNQCLNGAGPLFYTRWYNEFYRQVAAPPKRVVLVVNEYVFDPRYLVRHLEHDAAFLPWPVFLRALWRGDGDRTTLLYNRFALTHFRAAIWFTWFGHPEDERARMDLWYRGFVPVYTETPFARGVIRLSPREETNRIAALTIFVQQLRETGVEVALVNPPICASGVELTGGASERLRVLAAETGAAWLDYHHALASSLNQDRSKYVDWEHLNIEGARQWSARLAIDLAHHFQSAKAP